MEVEKQEVYKLVGKDGSPVCNVTIRFFHEYEGQILIGGEINIIVSYQPKKQGVLSPSTSSEDYDFEWWNTKGKYSFVIADFDLPPEIRRKGVGTFIWHNIFWGIPEEIRRNFMLSGKLAPQDASLERDSLWKNLINYGEDPIALFKSNSKTMGYFRGRIHDVGNSFEDKLSVLKKT